jgi:hypothetical protein
MMPKRNKLNENRKDWNQGKWSVSSDAAFKRY